MQRSHDVLVPEKAVQNLPLRMRYMFTSPRENTSGNPYLLPLPIAAQLVCFSVKYYLKRFYQEMNRFLDHKLSFILIYRVTFFT